MMMSLTFSFAEERRYHYHSPLPGDWTISSQSQIATFA
jgi:hypothetical protein